MKLLISILLFLLITGSIHAQDNNHYTDITKMLQIEPVPYLNPKNAEEAEANLAYIVQHMREILADNKRAIARFKRAIYAEQAIRGGN